MDTISKPPGEPRLISDSGGGFGRPAMREQLADPAVGLSRQARQDVLEIEEGIVAVQFGRLDQTHDGGGAFAGTQAAGK